MGPPVSRRALVLMLVIVLAVAIAGALAFAWMRARRSDTLEDRARDKAAEMQERVRELTQ